MESRTAEDDCKKVMQGGSAFLFLAKRKVISCQGWRLLLEDTHYAIQKYYFSSCPYHVIDIKRACLLVANFIKGVNTSEMKFRTFSAVERFHFVTLTGLPVTQSRHFTAAWADMLFHANPHNPHLWGLCGNSVAVCRGDSPRQNNRSSPALKKYERESGSRLRSWRMGCLATDPPYSSQYWNC